MSNAESLEIIGDIASQQWGLCTAKQASNEGVTPLTLSRLGQKGSLVRIRHGVYATIGTTISPALEVKAQWLALQPEQMAADRIHDPALASEAVISHTTAAELWGIGDLWPDGVHFTISKRRQSRQPGVQFHRDQLKDHEWTLHPEHGLPVTTAARTIVDLARDGHEPDHLLDLIADAGAKKLVQEQELLAAFSGREALLGATKGNQQDLQELWKDCFPKDDPQEYVEEAVEKSLHPIFQQMDELTRRVSVHSEVLNKAFESMLGNSPVEDMLKKMQTDYVTAANHVIQRPLGDPHATTPTAKDETRSDRLSVTRNSEASRDEHQ